MSGEYAIEILKRNIKTIDVLTHVQFVYRLMWADRLKRFPESGNSKN
jgi:hypothetical protein